MIEGHSALPTVVSRVQPEVMNADRFRLKQHKSQDGQSLPADIRGPLASNLRFRRLSR
jgi:hypothetical protein